MALMIKKIPFASAAGDAALHGGGGFSLKLRFWWHLLWPKKVYRRTKKFLENNKKGNFISINVLEFVVVIINYCAALHILQTEHPTEDPHPVFLNECDSTSAIRWATICCKESLAGRALGRLFCMLLVNSPLGINSKYINTKENFIADTISRLEETESDAQRQFNYARLKKQIPELSTCRLFQPSPKLLSLIWDAVTLNKSPSLEAVKTMRQSGLGKLIS